MRLCCIGGDVEDSLSPVLHSAMLRSAGVDGVYHAMSLRDDELTPFLTLLRQGSHHGCNVTMPFKRAVAAACDRLEGDAALLGAVNTVTVEDGRLVGANTDSNGFRLALRRCGLTVASEVLLLGAGGAAAAVALALRRQGMQRLVVVARNPREAAWLSHFLTGVVVIHVPWDSRAVSAAVRRAGMVVNATPLTADALPLAIRDLPASCTVADVRYLPRPVEFVERAAAAGHPAADGAEMLLQQAMLSFRRWTGAAPDESAARKALERALLP